MSGTQDGDPKVVLDTSKIRDIVERSDIDRHVPLRQQKRLLGEDWGGGFFVQEEPVLVQRGPAGEIVRTVPLVDIPGFGDPIVTGEEQEPVEGRMRPTPTPLPTSEREKLAGILALRLFRWYASQPPTPMAYNPVHDGIPDLPEGAHHSLNPLPGTNLYPATRGQVLERLKRVVASREQLVNRKKGIQGYRPDIATRAGDYAVRIKRRDSKVD